MYDGWMCFRIVLFDVGLDTRNRRNHRSSVPGRPPFEGYDYCTKKTTFLTG